MDVSPAMEARHRLSPLGATAYGADWQPIYRDLAYVKAEVTALAKQLAARASPTVKETL
jgi:hypothetical protein